MAIKTFNSVAGFSVGEYPSTTIVDANSNVFSNNLFVSSLANLGSISNVKITGGSAGQTITTDGAGNLVFTTVDRSTLSNGSSNIQVLNSSNINFSAAGSANVMVITNTGVNINGTISAGTSNISGGNFNSTGQFVSTVATGIAPLVVNSNTIVSNLNASLLNGYNTSPSAVGSTIVLRDGNGNVNANYFIGNGSQLTGIGSAGSISNGTSNVTILSPGGNVNISVGGIGNVLFVTTTGTNVSGTLNVTGNTTVGNINTGGQVIATGNITSNSNLISDNILGRTGALTITSAGTNTNINLKPNGTGNVDANSTYITNVKDPTNAQDAATKNYVDAAVTSLHVHQPCNVATTTDLATATGGTITYNNGSSGVGATLTLSGTPTRTFTAAGTFDTGYTALTNDRVLVKSQTTQLQNGIYVVTSSTVLTRATDADTSAELNGGDFTFVQSGGIYADTGWVQTTDAPVVGTSPIVWAQFSGAGTYTAGTGITLTGTQFSITNTTVTAGSYGNGDRVATFTVNAQGQLTAAANTAITANAANLTGTTLNSTIVTSSLTSVGTLSTLNVSGNVILGNSTVTTAVSWASVTTTSVTANQTIATFSVAGVTGVEFLVKGADTTGSKYSVATVHAVTDGTNVDWSTFGGVTLGGYTGTFTVSVSTGQLRLQVTPASSNSTVWTTQYKFV